MWLSAMDRLTKVLKNMENLKLQISLAVIFKSIHYLWCHGLVSGGGGGSVVLGGLVIILILVYVFAFKALQAVQSTRSTFINEV